MQNFLIAIAGRFVAFAKDRSPVANTLVLSQLVHHLDDDYLPKEFLEALLQYGADVNYVDGKGRPLLFYTACNNKVHLTRYLLSNGARITGETNGRPWCALWWPFLHNRIVDAMLDHVNRDLTRFLLPGLCGVEVCYIRTPKILAIALEMGADPSQVIGRSVNREVVENLLRCYDRRFQVVRWRRLNDESRRLRDTPLVKGARTRTSARSAHHPSAYVSERMVKFKPLPCVDLAAKARRSLEGQVLEFVLTRMSGEVFKTLIDEGFALV